MINQRVTRRTYEEQADLPETLYKYRDWNAPHHNTILTRREVYFAAPDTFEDKMDCKNPIRYDLLSTKEKRQFVSHRIYSEGLSRQARRAKAKELARNSNLNDKASIEKHNEETFIEYCKRAGVLSLTANPLSIELWERYSHNHEGFCVGFETKKALEYFGAAGQVIYEETLPIIYPEPKCTRDEQHIKHIFYKEKKWELEQEFRAHKFRGHPMSVVDRTIKLPPEAFKEIILGARIKEETKLDLLSSLPEELKHLPIKEAIINGNDMVIRPLAINV